MQNLSDAIINYAKAVAAAEVEIQNKAGQKMITNALHNLEMARVYLEKNGVTLPIGVPH